MYPKVAVIFEPNHNKEDIALSENLRVGINIDLGIINRIQLMEVL